MKSCFPGGQILLSLTQTARNNLPPNRYSKRHCLKSVVVYDCMLYSCYRTRSFREARSGTIRTQQRFFVFKSRLIVTFVVKTLLICCSIFVLHFDSPDCTYYIKGTFQSFSKVQGIFLSHETRIKFSRLKQPNPLP